MLDGQVCPQYFGAMPFPYPQRLLVDIFGVEEAAVADEQRELVLAVGLERVEVLDGDMAREDDCTLEQKPNFALQPAPQ